jgi:hypothetical protein
MIERFIGAVTLVALLSWTASGQDAQTIVRNVSVAMGVEGLNSISYFGQGSNYSLGQSPTANGPWPRLGISDYKRSIDFTGPASRASGQTIGPAGGSNVSVVQRDFNQLVTPGDNTWAEQLDIWVTP